MQFKIHEALTPPPKCADCKTVTDGPESWKGHLAWILVSIAGAITLGYHAYGLDLNSWILQSAGDYKVEAYWTLVVVLVTLALIALFCASYLTKCLSKPRAVCCSLDEDGKLHIHPLGLEHMLVNSAHTVCQIVTSDGKTESIAHRKMDTPLLCVHLQGFRAPRASLHNRPATKWRVQLDAQRRLCLTEFLQESASTLCVPIFEEHHSARVLRKHNIEIALQLLAEESNTLVGFVERGFAAWRDELPNFARDANDRVVAP